MYVGTCWMDDCLRQ